MITLLVTGRLVSSSNVYYRLSAGGGTSISPGVGVLTVSGLQPTVSASASRTPDIGTITVSGLAPAVTQAVLRSPGIGTITLGGLLLGGNAPPDGTEGHGRRFIVIRPKTGPKRSFSRNRRRR